MKKFIQTAICLLIFSIAATAQKIDTIGIKEAHNFVGKEVVLRGKVASSRRVESIKGVPTFINMKEDTTNFTVLVWDDVAQLFKSRPDTTFVRGSSIVAKGIVDLYRGKAQIVIRVPQNLRKE